MLLWNVLWTAQQMSLMCVLHAASLPHIFLIWQHNMSAVRYRTAIWLMREQRLAQVQINQSSRWQHNMMCCELQDRKEKDSFFNWFYFAINLGSFLAVTTLVYIQESVSWTIGFAIPAAAMLLAVVTFVAGSSKYVHVEPTERWATARQPVTSSSRCLPVQYVASMAYDVWIFHSICINPNNFYRLWELD